MHIHAAILHEDRDAVHRNVSRSLPNTPRKKNLFPKISPLENGHNRSWNTTIHRSLALCTCTWINIYYRPTRMSCFQESAYGWLSSNIIY